MYENHTIFVIDDDSEICKSLQSFFQSIHFNVETYSHAKLYLEKYQHQKGCIILDVRMPNMSGLELLDILKTQDNPLPVIMMSGYNDVSVAVRAMKSGAIDFVLKPINTQHLLKIIQECLQTQVRMNGKKNNEIINRIALLSIREKQILELIVKGKLNKEIAYELHISLSTVEAHRARIMHKLQVKNLVQLIKLYLQGTQAEEC